MALSVVVNRYEVNIILLNYMFAGCVQSRVATRSALLDLQQVCDCILLYRKTLRERSHCSPGGHNPCRPVLSVLRRLLAMLLVPD